MTAPNARIVDAFFDLRSPYSYLALKPARTLAENSGVAFEWWPFLTDFQSAYGGEVEQRSPRDVAKLKYLYMDCRRLAKLQGLTVRSTIKLWDATLGSKAVLFAKSKGRLWEFCDPLLAAFWKREFDLESHEQVEAAVVAAGLSAEEWCDYLRERAARDLDAAQQHADQLGVFGAPTFVYAGEMYWGGDRLGLLASSLASPSLAPVA